MGRTVRYVLICLAIVAVAGIYTTQSISYWKGYKAGLEQKERQLQADKQAALHGSSSVRLVAIRRLDDTVQHRDELCRTNWLFGWQSLVVPPVRDGVKTCQAKVKTLNKVATPLHELRRYLDFTAKLESAVAPLKTPSALAPSNWNDKGLKSAQQALASLRSLPAEGDAKALKDRAVGISNRTVAGWKALIDANKAKDVSRYGSASSQLAHAYADLMELADLADTAIAAKTAKLNAVADTL